MDFGALSVDELLATLPVALVVADLTGRCRYANVAAEALFGIPRDQLLGHSLSALAANPVGFRAAFRRAVGRSRYGFNAVVRRGDGVLVATRWDGALIQGGQGGAPVLLAVQATTAELREALDTETQGSPGIALGPGPGLSTVLDRVLEGALTALGRSSGAVILAEAASGRPVAASTRGLSAEAAEALAQERPMGYGGLTGQAFVSVPLVVSNQVLGALVLDPGEGRVSHGERERVLAVADLLAMLIARWREAEQARAQAEADRAQLAGVLAALPLAVYTVDGAGRLSAANPAACHLAQAPAPALLGRPCREAFPLRDEAGRLLCDWACPRARQGGAPVAGDVRAFLPDPQEGSRAVAWSCAPLRAPGGRLLGWVEVVRDISQLQAVEAARRALLAAASHELLSPIAIIKGHAETLRDPAMRTDPQLVESALVAIDEEAERLRRLVANMLDAAHAASGTFTIERVPVALGPVIERIVERFRGRSRRHQFVLSLPGPLPLVLGDRQRLESVLYNLLDNAVKYSPQGGRVLVRAVIHADEVEVIVEDEGVGIRREDQARIFERYYRAGPDRRPPVAGSGLGLYLCRTIIDAHGGRIWVESRPGRGAAFHFTVPRAGPAELPATRTPDSGET